METITMRKRNVRCFALAIGFILFALAENAQAFVVINEIMYNPAKTGPDVEWIELLNDAPTTCELDGWQFTNGVEFTFPAGSSIPPHGCLVVCSDPKKMQRASGSENVAGPFDGKLDNAGETIDLRNGSGGLIDSVDYQDDAPWPAGADGTGHSLSLVDPLDENQRGASWRISDQNGGTPGQPNFPEGPRPRSIAINEVLCESSGKTWIELFNPTREAVDVSGYNLSDDADEPDRFTVPDGTKIEAGGFIVFDSEQLGFELTPKRRKVFLSAPKAKFIADAIAYRDTATDHSMGRLPDGSDAWFRMRKPTPGAANAVDLNTFVVINEIMYQSFTEREEDEYVELYNRGDSPVDLTGWAFTQGIEFEFPEGTKLAPDSYLVVAKDQKAIAGLYKIDNCIGDYKKQLNNDRDRIVLADALGNTVDEVTYYDSGRWPEWANGGGSSLELVDPRQENDHPSAWAASHESGKARWTQIEYAGKHGDGRSEMQLFLTKDGIALIDDIRLRQGERDFLTSGTFDRDTKGWTIDGTHKHSTRWTEESRNGGACLRVVSVGRGDTGVNSIKIDTSGTLVKNEEYTVSYWAKWQAGNNRLCTRTHDNGVAATHALPVPRALGTPGRRNSRYRANTGPIIAGVSHDPAAPSTQTVVTVRAQIRDADGVASASVVYRKDSWSTWTAVAMHKADGSVTNAFTAELPRHTTGTVVQFYIKAADPRGAERTFPDDAPERVALYRVSSERPRPHSVKTFDLLLTEATRWRLIRRADADARRMDDEFYDATMIVNGSRVFYNVGMRFGGSPWLRPARGIVPFVLHPRADRPSYRVRFNADEPCAGLTSVNFDSQNVDATRIHERMFVWLLEKMGGVPFGWREFVGMHENGKLKGIYELVQRVDRRMLKDYFPDGNDGDLYKIETAYEWKGGNFDFDRTHLKYYGDDKEAYRNRFEKRSDEKGDGFSPIINLCRLFDRKETLDDDFRYGIEENVDVDEWLRSLACQAVASDWDGFGFMTGKNARLYRRNDTGRWITIPYDKDLTWGNSQMPIISKQAPGVARFLKEPAYARRYYAYIQELLDGPFTLEEVEPRIFGLHAMLEKEGDNAAKPTAIVQFVEKRRKCLEEKELPKPVDFAITTGGGKDHTSTTATIVLEGTAPLSVQSIELNEKPAEFRWIDAVTWRIENVELQPGENRFRVTANQKGTEKKLSAEIAVTRE